jgi:uncharacterized membrane protein YbhN (UPF0104 family)
MSKTSSTLIARARQVLPFVGMALLLAYFLSSTDLPAVWKALQTADITRFSLVVVGVTLAVWVYDSLCLVWLVRRTLGHRGKPGGGTFAEIAPVKAVSYVLNIVNYHAASLGMAFLVGRRKGVPFLEAAGAFAVLSYLDLLAVAGMAVLGLLVDPTVVSANHGLHEWIQAVAATLFALAVLSLVLLQSGWQVPWLVRLRQVSVLRPLSALGPTAMLQGLLLRVGLVLAYTVATVLIMQAFGMQPQWGRMLVAMPILTVVGTVPISVSGIGTTQVLMRVLYAPFVVSGAPGPVIDAFSSAMIVGYIVVRVVLAAPFLRKITAELRGAPGIR